MYCHHGFNLVIGKILHMAGVRISKGRPFPLGPSIVNHVGLRFDEDAAKEDAISVNLAIHARVENLSVCVFPPASQNQIIRDILLHVAFQGRTGDVWHIELRGVPYNSSYALRVDTPNTRTRLLSDPFAKWLESRGSSMWMQLEGENSHSGTGSIEDRVKKYIHSFPTLKEMGVQHPFRPSRFSPPRSAEQFDWGDVEPPRLAYSDLVIYEAHIRGLTARGTFESAITRIPYLKWLGITALQLMPIFEFSETEVNAFNGDYGSVKGDPELIEGRKGNMWGYSPMSWFSPMNRYSQEEMCGGSIGLKKLVRALHAEGLECYLDVVYNHTANSSCSLHFLGVQASYYIGKQKSFGFEHSNLSGCGNTLAPARPLVLELIMDSLRWWVSEYHIDGFRLDAAGILCRDEIGNPIARPRIIEHIVSDPVLKSTKFIVEGWDAGDQIGSPNMLLGSQYGFPHGERFCEWNVEWRDATRQYMKGDTSWEKKFRDAIRGSPRIFDKHNREEPAFHGVNFVSCHDGMCMADVVTFSRRKNRDGYDEISFNCGSEGIVPNEKVMKMRARRLRNFVLALGISRGIPMIMQGDEIGASKDGHSNTWNDAKRFSLRLPHDDIGLMAPEWSGCEGLVWFCKYVFYLRREFEELRRGDFMKHVTWLDLRGRKKGLREGRLVAFTVKTKACSSATTNEYKWLYVGFYNGQHSTFAKLPDVEHCSWKVILDTFRWDPNAVGIEGNGYEVGNQATIEYGSHSAIVVVGTVT